MTASALNGQLPQFIGSTGGLLNAAETEEKYAITWTSNSAQAFELPTGGAAMMNSGENVMYFARKEQCLALGPNCGPNSSHGSRITRSAFSPAVTPFLYRKTVWFLKNERRSSMVGHNPRDRREREPLKHQVQRAQHLRRLIIGLESAPGWGGAAKMPSCSVLIASPFTRQQPMVPI